MQGKRFVASTMRLALKMVKEELGPDAVILSNRQVPGGVELLTAVGVNTESVIESDIHSSAPVKQIRVSDNPFVQDEPLTKNSSAAQITTPSSKLEAEVEKMRNQARQRAQDLAAVLAKKFKGQEEAVSDKKAQGSPVEPTEQSVESPSRDNIQQDTQAVNNVSVLNEACEKNSTQKDYHAIQKEVLHTTSLENSKESSAELMQMRNDLQSMRDLLEQQLSSMAWGQYNRENPEKASLWRRLKRMGVGADLANTLIDSVSCTDAPADCWQTIMEKLSYRLPVSKDNIVSGGGVYAFVGPTGAGKTTTIAKLAAQYVLKNGAESVALVTTDTLRIAAQEQLRTVARILNIPIKVADKNNSLDRVLYSLRHKSLILIDTAGLNQADLRLKQQLSAIGELGDHVKTLLVIPTTSQAQVIKAAFHTYKTDNLHACVLTKLDETASLGESICLAVEKNLPVAYSTDGQNIPQDIAVADSVALVKKAIKLAKHAVVDDDTMAQEIASCTLSG